MSLFLLLSALPCTVVSVFVSANRRNVLSAKRMGLTVIGIQGEQVISLFLFLPLNMSHLFSTVVRVRVTICYCSSYSGQWCSLQYDMRCYAAQHSTNIFIVEQVYTDWLTCLTSYSAHSYVRLSFPSHHCSSHILYLLNSSCHTPPLHITSPYILFTSTSTSTCTCTRTRILSGFSQASHELRAADKVIMALDTLELRDLYTVSIAQTRYLSHVPSHPHPLTTAHPCRIITCTSFEYRSWRSAL